MKIIVIVIGEQNTIVQDASRNVYRSQQVSVQISNTFITYSKVKKTIKFKLIYI